MSILGHVFKLCLEQVKGNNPVDYSDRLVFLNMDDYGKIDCFEDNEINNNEINNNDIEP